MINRKPRPPKQIVPGPTNLEVFDARLGMGLTRRQCGALVGVSPTTWGKWEFGAVPMPGELWEAFKRAIETGTTEIPGAHPLVPTIEQLRTMSDEELEHLFLKRNDK